MKLFFTSVFLCWSVLFAQTISPVKQVEELSKREAGQSNFNISGRSLASENYDLKYARCEWELDPSARYIKGTVTLYFTASTDLSNITLDLSSSLVTDSVVQRGTKLSFSRPTEALKVNFPGTIPLNALDSISIFYKGVPGNSGFGSFVQDVHAGTPVIWSLSESYGAKDWWPCKTNLGDKLDSLDVYIKHPVAYRAASNGLLQSEIISEGGTKMTAHWKHRYPIASYLVCFAVTNYSVFNNSVTLGSTSLPMQTYCYPEDLGQFQANTQLVLDAMKLFHQNFGDYPFIKEKYGHVQFGWGGGMEHQTSTFIVIPDEGLMAHELGHQWFGDKITTNSWEDIWLNEGFATYLASFYMENKYPANRIANRINLLNNITSQPNGSVKVIDTFNVNRIFDGRLSYNKGSYLLNMLRLKLGDADFFNGLREYQKDPSLAYRYARTADLKRNLEKVSGQDLNKFFDQWYTGQGYPSYNVLWSQVGSGSVKVTINQTTSDPSVTFFEMPVPLKFKNATREKTILFNNKLNGETFTGEIGFIADTVIIDPEYWLISKNNISKQVGIVNTGAGLVDIYPNPVTNPLNIFLHDFTSASADLTVFSANGQLIYRRKVNLVNGAEMVALPTGTWARGMYTISVQAGDRSVIKQIIK